MPDYDSYALDPPNNFDPNPENAPPRLFKLGVNDSILCLSPFLGATSFSDLKKETSKNYKMVPCILDRLVYKY